MRAKIIILISIGVFLILKAPLVEAQTKPTEPETASVSAEENLNEKVQGIREAVSQKVQEKIEEVKKGPKKAFVGNIVKIKDGLLTLDSSGGEKQVTTDDETIFIDLSRKKIEIEDLKIDDHIIAMGYFDSSNNLLYGRRIVIAKKPKPIVLKVVFGQITDQTAENEKIIMVKNPKIEKIYEVEATSKTKINQKIKDKIEDLKFEKVAIGNWVVAIGTPGEKENGFLSAKLIRILAKPQTAEEKK